MKYSELLHFEPITEVVKFDRLNDVSYQESLVRTFVFSKEYEDTIIPFICSNLDYTTTADTFGLQIVGNYGTGKSHLMSVISAVATDADNLQYLQNQKFAKQMEPIAGRFEVLRIEIGGVVMPLYNVIMSYVQDDFDRRRIDFKIPEYSSVKSLKNVVQNMMIAFSEKYPDKGYLIIVDEFLSYLSSRNEREIVLDLEFFRALGEMCSKSKLRVIFGMQEKIFDNPRFSFVADTLKHVSDRFSQLIITKEATSYVVSERILKKTSEQKAMIRKHLEQFCSLYTGMSSRLDEFVELFPIHPSYIDVFNKIYLIENRHILKNISVTIKNIFNTDVPQDAPGIISFDNYWPAIKSNGLLKSDVTISRVVNASQQLEDIINRAFPKEIYKPMAIKIIYALSVHRLTTNGLDVQFGLTAENMKDDLCLYLSMPEQDADFLLSLVKTILRDIMTTVSGQFIIYNDANNQYYIDVDKIVDYDEKIKQKASIMADGELNRYFYDVVYRCLEWDAKQYVTNFNIYEYDLNWDSHNIFREGYLFMGLPGERSTAHPERDFYIHIMPPYEENAAKIKNLSDEVYLYFKSSKEFYDDMSLYSAAQSLAQISEGKDKDAYLNKAHMLRKRLIKYLSENKNTCFDVMYKGQKCQMIEVLKGHYNRDMTFKDTIDLAASLCFDEYFYEKYPEFPVMKTKITRRNMIECVRAAFDHFAGRKSQQSVLMLQSFGILDGDKIRPENSKYAAYYIEKVRALPPKGVLNYSDIFEQRFGEMFVDKKFSIEYVFTPIIFLSMVYGGYVVITLKDGRTITASNLDQIPKINVLDLYEFKYLSRPSQVAMAELKRLFEVLDINPALLDNPQNHEKGVTQLTEKAQELANQSTIAASKLNNSFDLWGEPLASASEVKMLQGACDAIRKEFSDYVVKFNTPAKLNNFSLSMEQIDTLDRQIKLMKCIQQFMEFKTGCADIVSYIANIEFIDLGEAFKTEIDDAKASFRSVRDNIMDGISGDMAAQDVEKILSRLKTKYIDIYFENHKKKRLDITEAKRRNGIREGKVFANLCKLRSIDILSTAKLSDIEAEMSGLKVCYELTPEELKTTHICPHCRYHLDDKEKNTYGVLDDLESRIEDLLAEWTKTLLDTISDPIVESQKTFLSAEQQRVIDSFVGSGALPECIDDFFVKSVNELLKGFEPVVIDTDELMAKLEQLPPMDEMKFNSEIAKLVKDYTKGKNAEKLRIVVKRKESEG